MPKKPENNRNSIGRFVEGSSGNPNGRPVGSKNKFTTPKNAFIETFEELGGVDNLVEWARANQIEFYRMVARLMPKEVEAKVSTQFTLLDALMEMDFVKGSAFNLRQISIPSRLGNIKSSRTRSGDSFFY